MPAAKIPSVTFLSNHWNFFNSSIGKICKANFEQCTICKDGYYLKGFECVIFCGQGYRVQVSPIKECVPCPTECAVCTEDGCINCFSPYFLGIEKDCRLNCGDYYYPNSFR